MTHGVLTFHLRDPCRSRSSSPRRRAPARSTHPLQPRKGNVSMPLFEIETESHIIITWAEDQDAAAAVVNDAYPEERVMRLTKRPRDTWVISKSALGISGQLDICHTARDCLSKAA